MNWAKTSGLLMTSLAGGMLPALGMVQLYCRSADIPYFAMVGTATGLVCAACSAVAWRSKAVERVERRHVPWILLRGLFGTCNYGLVQSAISMGTALHTIAILQTTSVIVAGMWGAVFQTNRVSIIYWLALMCNLFSIVVTLSGSAVDKTACLGILLAVCSGMFSGSMILTVRKLREVDDVLLCSVVSMCHMVNFWSLYVSGVVDQAPLQSVVENQQRTLIVFTILVGLILLSVVLICKGGKLHHANGSSIGYCLSNMAVGFVGQVIFSDEPLKANSYAGLSLTLVSMLLLFVAPTRLRPNVKSDASGSSAQANVKRQDPVSLGHTQEEDKEDQTAPHEREHERQRERESGGQSRSPSPQNEDDDVVSLATFIASEVSGLTWYTHQGARQRRPPAIH